MRRRIDEWGRVWFHGDDAVELLMRGADITQLLIDPDAAITTYNEFCQQHNKAAYRVPEIGDPALTPEDDTAQRINTWFIPAEYQAIDVRQRLLARCTSREAIDRVNHEMDMFEARSLVPILRLMIYLVDHWRKNGVVWGVGRGSSVASYCLFLIGVHHIDAMAFGLSIDEYLR